MSSDRQEFLDDLRMHRAGQEVPQTDIDDLAAAIAGKRRTRAVFVAAAASFGLVVGLVAREAVGASVLGGALLVIGCVACFAYFGVSFRATPSNLPVSMQSAAPLAQAVYRLGSAQLSQHELAELALWSKRDPIAAEIFDNWTATHSRIYERDARMLRRYLYTCPVAV